MKGFTQVDELDFHETFVWVAKLVSVRVFLAVVVAKGWIFHQMDVNNAFLDGDLEEKIYMRLLPDFAPKKANQVRRLRKCIYGLRQASRNWFAKLASYLRDYGFIQLYANYSSFTYRKGRVFMCLIVNVDDLILVRKCMKTCLNFKHYLNKCFE